ncbi:MAG: hypothetical protein CL674_01030 [Bdellovibrionaceae bacterium]|nr:hypothetical protein [Pseudobdellovibrionaceae bacterium]
MKSVLVFLVLTFGLNANSFIDVAESAQKAIDYAAMVSAAGDLVEELDEENKKLTETEGKIRELRHKIDETETFGRNTKGIMDGPNSSAKDTASKVSSLTSYIRDLKRYYSKYFAGGTSPETSLAIDKMIENNRDLREKNQQAKESLQRTEEALLKTKKIKEQREKDLSYRKFQNDQIKNILGVGEDVQNN